MPLMLVLKSVISEIGSPHWFQNQIRGIKFLGINLGSGIIINYLLGVTVTDTGNIAVEVTELSEVEIGVGVTTDWLLFPHIV